MFGCTSQTQCMFVGQQGNLNAGDDDRYQINNVQFSFRVQRATADRESMETVKASQPFFASWKVIQSFSFPIELLVFSSWSAVGVQAHHRWIFGGQVRVKCCFYVNGSVELKKLKGVVSAGPFALLYPKI